MQEDTAAALAAAGPPSTAIESFAAAGRQETEASGFPTHPPAQPPLPPQSSSTAAAPPAPQAPLDPAQALREKMAALERQAAAKKNKPDVRRFKRGNAAASGDNGSKDASSSSSYLDMVRKLSHEKEGDAGGKWLVR